MVRVTNERPARSIPSSADVPPIEDGDDAEWPDAGGTGGADQWKQPVRVASTGDLTISAIDSGDSIDGVTLAEGDRILIKDQGAPEENGIYIVGADPGDTVRAGDMDDDDEVLGSAVYVIAGTANAATTWAVTNTAPTVVDTDAINWAEVGGGGSIPGGTFELANEGGQSVIYAHGSMGSTETIDPTDGNVHTGTLTADCTVTLNAPTGSGAALLELWLTQDGTGGWDITWPGSVTVNGTPDTTAGTTTIWLVDTVDGGTTWVAFIAGGGTSVAALDDLTDVTITAPAEHDRLAYNGSTWVNDAGYWEPVTNGDVGTPEVVFEDGDIVMEWVPG